MSATVSSKKAEQRLYVPPARRKLLATTKNDITKGDKFSFADSTDAASSDIRLPSNYAAQFSGICDTKMETDDLLKKLDHLVLDNAHTLVTASSKNYSKSANSQAPLEKVSTCEPYINFKKFQHVLEFYGLSKAVDTSHLEAELTGFKSDMFHIYWVDDTRCLVVFSSADEATRALAQISGVFVKARRIEAASTESKLKLYNLPEACSLPYKKRPPTSAVTARRLISWHLGLKHNSTTDAAAAERLRQDRISLQQAKVAAEERRRIQKAMWEDE